MNQLATPGVRESSRGEGNGCRPSRGYGRLNISAFITMAVLVLSLSTNLNAQDVFTIAGPKKPARIDQKLNQKIPLDLTFRDERGSVVRLGDYFGSKPVILNLVYFGCPMLCNVVTDGLVSSVSDIRFNVGKEYTILTVSFDPKDGTEKAAAWSKKYVRRYGRRDAASGWHFLTGDPASIKALTDAVGFRFFFDPPIGQYAHGAGIVVLTPDGRVSRYLYGIEFPSRDLRLALIDASENKIGSLTDKVLLLCFHYDPATGKYSANAMNAVRAGGVAAVAGLAGFVMFLIRSGRSEEGGTRRP
ncbi:MAG TPA: SCO family protein [Thermoanaerobaculia bacterium]|nr:SCO family protein [Thermoanaerobaculia bacterium]